MAGNFKVSMTLTVKDEASKVIAKGMTDTSKAATEAEKAAARVNNEQKKGAEGAARITRTASEEYRRAARARETLGVRSEQSIQREIAQTIASYNRLARTTVMSSREQERAFRRMKDQVRELKTEMRGYSRMGEVKRFGSNAMAIGGGIAAGAAVLSRPVANQMSYERQLSMMANTAFGDDGQAGRLAGRTKLANSIRAAVMSGGGTKEDAAEAMNNMIASGAVSYETADKWLPTIMKNATASGASAIDLSSLAIKAKQSFGLTDEDIPVAMNMAIAAGKAGNFELKDMARWLAPQMAAASSSGMKGIDDFAKLLTLNEAAGITAGNSDEAGNNVVNLLAKLTSQDAANAAKRIKVNGKGIDLAGSLANAKERGIDPIEAFSRIVDRVVAQNGAYQKLQKRLAGTKEGSEQRAVMESMANILEGSGVGKIIADRQALMALLAYRNNPEYRKDVESQINAQRTLKPGETAGDQDFAFIAGTNDFKIDQAKNANDFAQMDSVKSLANAAGAAAGELTALAEEFPGLATAAAGATTAIQTMTGAAIAFAGLKFLTGGGVAAATGAASGGTAAVAGAAAQGSGGFWSGLLKLGGSAMAATSLATLTSPEEDAAVSGSEERWKALRAKYPQSTIDAARKKYQPWYQFGEGYSTENEQWIQRYLADQASSPAAAVVPTSQVTNAAAPPAQASPAAAGTSGVPSYLQGQNAPQAFAPMNFTSQLVLDGQVVAEVVNQYNLQDGNRGTGGAG